MPENHRVDVEPPATGEVMMSNELLSQSDIDSLVAGVCEEGETSPGARAKPDRKPSARGERLFPEEPTSTPGVEKTPARNPEAREKHKASDAGSQNQTLSSLEARVFDLSHRLSRLESAVGRLERLEREMADAGTGVSANASPQQLHAVSRRVEELTQEVDGILMRLQGSVGYGVYYTFKCDRCHSQGSVATVFQCTKCGHYSWRGWWPRKKE
jgi:hypothetical protein